MKSFGFSSVVSMKAEKYLYELLVILALIPNNTKPKSTSVITLTPT